MSSYHNSADNLESYYDGANVDDGSDIDMEDDLLLLLDNAKKHSEEEEEDNNNNVGRDRRRRRRSWKKYLVSWYRKCSEEEEEENANKSSNKKRKRMSSYPEVQVQVLRWSGGGGGCWGAVTVAVLGRALRNSRAEAAVKMNYNKSYNDGFGTSGSPPPPLPYVSLHRRHHMKLDGGLSSSSSSYYGPVYLVT